MPSPFFLASLIRKYVVQSRFAGGSWKDHDSYPSLGQARRAVREMRQRNAMVELRIVNRMTGLVIE